MLRRRPPPLLALLLLLAGCSGGGVTSATEDGSGTSGSASTSASTSASASASTSATTSGSASASGSTDTAGSTTGDATTASATTASATTASTATSTGAGTETGGPLQACEDLGDVDFGDCEAVVGVIFDGEACRTVSGCGCEPHCDAVFADPGACAASCAAAGECNTGLFQGAGIAKGPWDMGSFCDDIFVCGGDAGDVGDVLPGGVCDAQPGYPCEASGCMVDHMGPGISAELWEDLCAASLLPGVSLVACMVFR